jgi:Zn-dependent M28 family amino/carboxypeptidase
MKLPITIFILLLMLFFAVSDASGQQQASISTSTPEQIKEDFAAVPCKDEERLNAVKALFEKMGAVSSSISIEKYKNVENLVVRKPGASQEIVVIGAHYDKVAEGCGAVDNWSGIVAIAHLYRTLKDIPLKKTVMFVAFGKEEKGLIGSRAMAEAIDKLQLEQYCAMINIDSFGLANPQVLDNTSNKNLTSLTASLAKEMKIPFAHASVEGADADSSAFLKKKIPALTLHGLSNEFMSVIHTRNDTASKVNEVSVYLGYRLVLALVGSLNESSCSAYK